MAILLLDIDGTLIEFGQPMPVATREALNAAHAAGHQLYICTGRTYGEIQPEIFELPLAGVLAGSGSYVRVGDDVIYHRVLDRTVVDRAIALCNELGIPAYGETSTGMFPGPGVVEAFSAAMGMDPEGVHVAFPSMRKGEWDDPSAPWRGDVSKFAVALHDPSQAGLFVDLFGEEATVESWSITADAPEFIEIRVKDSHKGVGVQILADHLGVPAHQMYGFGDSQGDIGMLKLTGTSVVMAEASDAVKAYADVVAPAFEEDGFAQVMAELGLV